MNYEAVVDRSRSDDRVLGLVLTGSRGRGPYAREDSDWDVRLVVRDDFELEATVAYGTERGSPVETVVLPLSGFERTAEIGSGDEWDRYSYAHAQVVVDKLGGRIEALVRRKGVLAPDEAVTRAAYKLDEYINSYYRSAKNFGKGLQLQSHLDAAESVGPFLAALFAMHERLRPYNKFLVWELTEHPLGGTVWAAERLTKRLHKIVSAGDLQEQQQLFRDLERLARERGHGNVVDGWEPDLRMLRGTA